MTLTVIPAPAQHRAHAHHFPPLELESRPAVPTEQAAHYLNRRPQTLRWWAMRDGAGPIRPLRVNGRLAWPVSEIRRVVGVA
ncbi:MAG TPA: hypothetical protein PKC60_00360 [Hydrogenophaga sp.]|uniref:hypothetical protein n=1 Tax=Hydrogenophaga sp. TaxID=1904254 RepID=UPI002CC5FA14|nr:hypothetical protein [Hydrogenophaga sp.]HMN91657.1 hypothetical protein [Hydrogenophaga sp.]